MSIVIKAGAGLLAGAVAGALGIAVLPQVEPNALKPRNAVEPPQFVAEPPPAPKAPRPAAALALATETPAAKPAPPPVVKPAPPVAVATPPQTAAYAAKPTQSAAAAALLAAALRASADPKPTPPSSAPASEGTARWSVRGLVALARGDLSTARLFLTRAAEAGDPRAFVALADTYDPAVLARLGVAFAPGDSGVAKDYLMKAAAAGVVAAKDRLAVLDPAKSEVH